MILNPQRILRAVLYPAARPDAGRLRAAVAGRAVLVTGASSGVGAATARRLGAAGATVLLVARSKDRLAEVRADIRRAGGVAHVHPADLAEAAEVDALAAELLESYGGADILVSNAGLSIRRSAELTYERLHDYERSMNVNFFGPVRLAMALLPAMRERGSGHVINVSTIGLQLPTPRYAAYLSSKAAFEYWLRGVAPEVRPDGVYSSSVFLGLVHTPMSAATELYRLMPGLTADQAADIVCQAVVTRRRVVDVWWARAAELAAVAARGPYEMLWSLYTQISTDSAAAEGEDGRRGPEVPLLGVLRRLGLP